MLNSEQYTSWWGTFQFEVNQKRYWHLGSCLICITRTQAEWQLASIYADEFAGQANHIAVNEAPFPIKLPLPFKGFGLSATTPEITLMPVLADRNQVWRLKFPFYVPAGQKITLYISSPVWLSLSIAESTAVLHEIPTQWQSDTWFGNSTREGELCYASRTHCFRSLDSSLLKPQWVISSIVIENHAAQNLLIERLKIPLPYLSVYACQEGFLWTEDLTMQFKTPANHTLTRIEKGIPKIAAQPQLLSMPRLNGKAGGIIDIINEFL